MENDFFTFFDTDMFIHRLSPDTPVKESAEREFYLRKPSAMSEFSLLELKGNYIASLILLRRKVADSDSLKNASSRIRNTGGRKTELMFAQLISWLDEQIYNISSWIELQNTLLTHLDAQISISWEMFKNNVDYVSKNVKCSRAEEEPEENNGKWSATIAVCKANNCHCLIEEHFLKLYDNIKKMNEALKVLKEEEKTAEINRIIEFSEFFIAKKNIKSKGKICRQLGDLLIGIDSIDAKGLLSSNYKEHKTLSKALGYNYIRFPLAEIRSK